MNVVRLLPFLTCGLSHSWSAPSSFVSTSLWSVLPANNKRKLKPKGTRKRDNCNHSRHNSKQPSRERGPANGSISHGDLISRASDQRDSGSQTVVPVAKRLGIKCSHHHQDSQGGSLTVCTSQGNPGGFALRAAQEKGEKKVVSGAHNPLTRACPLHW